MLFDLLWLKNENKGMVRGADTTLGLGLLGASGAALAGVADWSDLDGADLRVGFVHGLLNSSAVLSYLASTLYQPTRLREKKMRRFTSAKQAQRFLSAFGLIAGHFQPRRHRLQVEEYCAILQSRFPTMRRCSTDVL